MEFFPTLLSAIAVNKILVFGLCLLFGVLGGIMANRLKWLPTITAFMLLGFIIGPYGLRLISMPMLKESLIFIEIALGLILYDLGTMLHPKEMIRSRRLLISAIGESVCTYVVVFVFSWWAGLGPLISALIAAIAVSSSPSVLVHVAAEMRAAGPVSDRAKSLVAINNLIAFLLFSMALPFGMLYGEASMMAVVGMPLYRLAGAVVVGIFVAWLAVKISSMLRRQDDHYRFAIVIGAVMLSLGICEMFGVSALFSPLVLGLATRAFETRKNRLSHVGLGEGGDLFFIVLFVLAGAKINVGELLHMGWIPLGLVAARSFAKIFGIYVAGYVIKAPEKQSRAISMMLVPMAGMAIGLVTSTTGVSPEAMASLGTIIFAMVAIFEALGPFLVTYALNLSGEAGKLDDVKEGDEPASAASPSEPAATPAA